MLNMDQKVYNDTGKMSPAMIEEYEAKARLRLQSQREAELRDREAAGELTPVTSQKQSSDPKIHIGGGKYITMAEVEEIARTRINPTLQEISEQAEKQRAQDAADRLDKDERRRQERLDKEKDQERKLDEKRARGEP